MRSFMIGLYSTLLFLCKKRMDQFNQLLFFFFFFFFFLFVLVAARVKRQEEKVPAGEGGLDCSTRTNQRYTHQEKKKISHTKKKKTFETRICVVSESSESTSSLKGKIGRGWKGGKKSNQVSVALLYVRTYVCVQRRTNRPTLAAKTHTRTQ